MHAAPEPGMPKHDNKGDKFAVKTLSQRLTCCWTGT